MTDPQSGWFKLSRIPRPVGNAFAYAPLASLPLIIVALAVGTLVASRTTPPTVSSPPLGEVVTNLAGVSLLALVISYAAMVIFGIPGVLILLRRNVRSGAAWVLLGAGTGVSVGFVLAAPIFLAFHPLLVTWLATGGLLGAWNAYLLWRANEKASATSGS